MPRGGSGHQLRLARQGRRPRSRQDAVDLLPQGIRSVTGPFGDIVKPEHVKLLDYELEIGLVFGRELPVGTEVTDANLADYIAPW